MASIINLAPTTELEAVNAMLSAIGEAPIADVDTATQADADIAIDTLREVAREVQANGWRFNTEFGIAVAPAVTDFSWTEPDASSLPIDIFLPPAGMVAFHVSALPGQFISQHGGYLDLVIRPSKQYTAGSPAAPVLVLYDRSRNRDGFPASEQRDFLYIDPVWLFNFEHLPETARRYITIVAARRFTQRVLGDANIVAFQRDDELVALRALAREHGLKDRASMLDNPDTFRVLGDRPQGSSFFSTRRSRPVR